MKATRLIVLTLSLGFSVSVATAKERPRLAVLAFTNAASGLDSSEVTYLTELARSAALRSVGKSYDIITRESLVDLLKAHGRTLEQCVGECETETGRLIGADVVISGGLSRAFGEVKLTLKLHRTSPPQLLGTEATGAKEAADLQAAVTKATARMLASALGGAPHAPAGNTVAPQPAPRPAPAVRPTLTPAPVLSPTPGPAQIEGQTSAGLSGASITGWVLAGLGVVTAVVGVPFTLQANATDQLVAQANNANNAAEAQQRAREVETADNIALGLYVGGGIVALTGIILGAATLPDDSPTAFAVPVRGGFVLGLGGDF